MTCHLVTLVMYISLKYIICMLLKEQHSAVIISKLVEYSEIITIILVRSVYLIVNYVHHLFLVVILNYTCFKFTEKNTFFLSLQKLNPKMRMSLKPRK